MRLGRWAGAVIGGTLVGLAPAALAGPLNNAAAIVGANDPLGRPIGSTPTTPTTRTLW